MPELYINALLAGLLTTAVLAAVYDYIEQRIPNKLLLCSLIYALCMYAVILSQMPTNVWPILLRYPLLGMVLGGFVMYVPYTLKQVGAGDVKLMMVFGFYLGPIFTMISLLNGAVIGGVWALWISHRQGGLKNVFKNIKTMFHSAYVSGFKEVNWDLENDEAIRMPYGVALSGGVLLVVLWHYLK